jgi:hypothetical protein
MERNSAQTALLSFQGTKRVELRTMCTMQVWKIGIRLLRIRINLRFPHIRRYIDL